MIKELEEEKIRIFGEIMAQTTHHSQIEIYEEEKLEIEGNRIKRKGKEGRYSWV